MATTFVDYTGDGNATKAFSFPSIQESDIKVDVDGDIKSSGTHYNITGYTTTGGGNVVFIDNSGSGGTNHIPQSPSAIRIFRDTDVDSAKATYTAGSSVKAADLNANHEQLLFAAQEEQNQTVLTSHIKDAAVTSAKIKDGTIVNADINASAAIDGSKVNPAFGSQNITTSGTVDGRDVSADGTKLDGIETGATADQTAAEIRTLVESASDSNVFTDADHSKLNAIEASATADQTASEIKSLLQSNKLTVSEIADNAITTSKIQDAELSTLAGMQSGTASKLADSTALTADIADLNQIDGMAKQTTITDDDTKFPTSGAVVDYVAAQLEPFGGFEAIANEVSFPNTQPPAGVAISIADAAGIVVNGSGTSTTGRTVGGTTVTINNINSQYNSSTVASGIRFIVTSTGSGQVYNYHKSTLPESDLVNLSGDINDFNERYRVGGSNPTTSLDAGDLFYNTGTNKLLVYNATDSAWEETQSVGNFFINTISSSSATGGGSATPNGTAYRFTLSNAGANAQQHIVSVDGVIQKPNSGTSQPSEGFAVDGSDIILGAAPVSGASFFVITIGAAVSIGTPSNNTVTTAILQNGSVTNVKIVDDEITNAKVNTNAAIVATKLSFTQTGTGATARTIDSKLKDVISVKDFGATGDGSTNDATAINAALLAATGKTLYFPAGTYIIGAELQPKTGTTIVGDGIENTIIKASSSLATNITLINIVNGQDAVTIRDLRVNGNESNRSSGSGGSNNIMIMSNRNILERVSTIESENAGILFGNPSDASEENTINNCIIEDNNGVGLSQSNCSGTIITNNRFARNGLENLTIDANSNRTICTNNRFFRHRGGVGNIGWDDSVDSKFCDNFVDNQNNTDPNTGTIEPTTAANRNGICIANEISGADPTTHRCMISNNHIVNYKNNGIWLKDTDDSGALEDAGAFIISNNFLARAASPESGSTDIKIGKTTHKIIIEGNNAEDIDVDDATVTSMWGFSSDVQIGSTKHTVIDQFTDTDKTNDRIEPSVFVSATYDGGDLTGDPSAPLGIYAQHELKGATSTNAYTHSIMGYGLNNSAGDNDAIGTSGRARKLDVTNGIGDAAGIWGSAYQESTKNGGVMAAEASIYQNVAGTTAPTDDRLGAKWSASLHVNSDSTGSKAITGIGIDSTGNNSGKHGYWNGIIIDGNSFGSGSASAGATGTVGLNCGSWSDSVGYPEYGIKIGKSKYTLSLGDLPTDGYHLYKPNGDIKINANQTFFESANNSGLILDCGKGPTSGNQLNYIDFKINGGFKGNIVCQETVTGHPIQINSNNSSTGGVELFHGNGTTSTKRIETTATGASVTGYLTQSAPISWMAYGDASWTELTSGQSVYPYNFNNIAHNIGSHYKNSGTDAGLFVAPVAGVYQFNWNIFCQSPTNQTSAATLELYVRKNGSSVSRLHNKKGYGNMGDDQQVINLCVTEQLAANDTIGVIFSAYSATWRIYGAHSTFSGFLVG